MMSAAPEGADTIVRLKPLRIVEEENDVLVGDLETGRFVSIPPIGGFVIKALQQGRSLGEVQSEAEEVAGAPVDVGEFVAALRQLGFVDDGSASDTPRTAVIQGRRWLHVVSSRMARPLFGRVAWAVYGAALLFDVVLFLLEPGLWPEPRELFVFDNIGLSALVMMPFAMAGVAKHEIWHWLAARAEGLTARFGMDRRAYFLVFETDLSQIWSLPRNRRYGPQLAGMAVDAVVLAVLLGAGWIIEHGHWSAPVFVAKLIPPLIFLEITGMVWQCMIFMRTDLYGVLVTATGCRNLWTVKSLLLRQAFGRISDEQRAQLAAADAKDIRTARWFRWVWLAGQLVVLAYFWWFYVPPLVIYTEWTISGLGESPLGLTFWFTLACAVALFWTRIMWLVVFLTEMARRIKRRIGVRSIA